MGYHRILCSSLCYTVGPCRLSVLYIVVLYGTIELLIYPSPQNFPFVNRKFVSNLSKYLFSKKTHLYHFFKLDKSGRERQVMIPTLAFDACAS